MLKYPEVQKKAQEELARVVGPNRLPEFDDRPNLPYLEAVMKETLRWQMVTPVVVHVTSEADEYKGMYIPKNSVLIIVSSPNIPQRPSCSSDVNHRTAGQFCTTPSSGQSPKSSTLNAS